MYRLLPAIAAFFIGLFGLTGCAVTVRGAVTPITSEEFVQKGASDLVYDWLFGGTKTEKKS